MGSPKKVGKRELRRIAYREAGALIAADMDDADLACADYLSEEDESWVREFIRDHIADELTAKGTGK